MQLLPPQSDEEIRPFIEALQRLDEWLDVRWEPKAQVVKRGAFDAFGMATKLPEYEGRWQIIRYNTDRLHLERDYAVICEVTAIDESTPARLMLMHGAYAPMGWWVVEYMRRFDAAQAHFATEMEKVWAEHEQAESLDALINDHAAHREAAEKVYHNAAGPYWMGRGFGKGRRSTDAGAATITP